MVAGGLGKVIPRNKYTALGGVETRQRRYILCRESPKCSAFIYLLEMLNLSIG